MKKETPKKKEIIIIASLAALALLALFCMRLFAQKSGLYASVSFDGEEIMQIELNTDKIYHIDALLPVTLEVKDGGIRFLDSQCPDHVCEDFGLISEEYEYAVCMPARLVVLITSRDG